MLCSICLETISSSKEEEELECKHKYHTKCIEQWLVRDSSCPLCRKPMGYSREELMEMCYKIERNSFYLLMFLLVTIQLSLWLYTMITTV